MPSAASDENMSGADEDDEEDDMLNQNIDNFNADFTTSSHRYYREDDCCSVLTELEDGERERETKTMDDEDYSGWESDSHSLLSGRSSLTGGKSFTDLSDVGSDEGAEDEDLNFFKVRG